MTTMETQWTIFTHPKQTLRLRGRNIISTVSIIFYHDICLLYWLVVWNHGFLWFSIHIYILGIHNPNWRSPSFLRGVGLNHQSDIYWYMCTYPNTFPWYPHYLGICSAELGAWAPPGAAAGHVDGEFHVEFIGGFGKWGDPKWMTGGTMTLETTI